MTLEILVGSAERDVPLQQLGRVSAAVEQAGADVMWRVPNIGWCAIQRKAIPDLLSSMGGRLTEELAKMRTIPGIVHCWLVIEGQLRFTTTGMLMGQYGSRNITQAAIENLENSVQLNGVWVKRTDSIGHTVNWIMQTVAWSMKPEHRSLQTYAKTQMPKSSKWGTAESDEWMIRLLSSFPGMSVVRAKALRERAKELGLRAPMGWLMDQAQIESCPGIGEKISSQLVRALPVVAGTSPSATVEDVGGQPPTSAG